jgi:porphobilinogen synthase
MQFPEYRARRLRKNENFRRLIRETRLCTDDLVYPLFVVSGKNFKKPIQSMPGSFQMSVDNIVKEVKKARELGIPAVLLFGIPEIKDDMATGAFAKDGIVQQAVKRIKNEVPDILVITDVCLCEYTSHGHCGVLEKEEVQNDTTLEVLAETAVSHAQVAAIREALDENSFEDIPIMAYAAKYSSSFYGPFREAAESAPQFGNRKAYQMDSANSDEAIREISLDVSEGADIIMVKPALAYLDIIYRAKQEFDLPLAAYSVSGEYAMIKAAAQMGWLDEEKVMMESLTAIKRAGADIIITYFAPQAAALLNK